MPGLPKYCERRGDVFVCTVCLGHEMKQMANVQEHVNGKKHKRLVAKFAKSTHYTVAPPARDWLKEFAPFILPHRHEQSTKVWCTVMKLAISRDPYVVSEHVKSKKYLAKKKLRAERTAKWEARQKNKKEGGFEWMETLLEADAERLAAEAEARKSATAKVTAQKLDAGTAAAANANEEVEESSDAEDDEVDGDAALNFLTKGGTEEELGAVGSKKRARNEAREAWAAAELLKKEAAKPKKSKKSKKAKKAKKAKR